MPSIPQSLLWISLVVLWLFVLVPMLINRRDTVRRTSDLALATRVLDDGVKSRLIKRSGPAAGHRHDPDWQPTEQFAEDYPDLYDETPADFADQVIRQYDDAVREARMGVRSRSVVVVAAVSEQTLAEPDYLDVDVVDENSGALPVGTPGVQASLFDAPSQSEYQPRPQPEPAPEPEMIDAVADSPADDPVTEAWPAPQPEPRPEPQPKATDQYEADQYEADQYEYVEDSSGLEDEVGPPVITPRPSNRLRRMSNTKAAAVSARKYRFRKRMLMAMAGLMVLSAIVSFTVTPTLWWSCGTVAGVTVLYLAYLRRQTRIEEQVRRRRSQRMTRPRPMGLAYEEENFVPRGPEVDLTEFPTRLRRPGAVVLDIDDEDPIFEHLDEVPFGQRQYGTTRGMTRGMPGDLPRAAGQ